MMLEKTDLRDRYGQVRFLFVGRLVSEKGFDRVIEAARYILGTQSTKATLSIYGDGDMREAMLAKLSVFEGFLDASAGKLPQGGERVVYFGHRSSAEVQKALSGAHYMLMPSRFLETFGLSALEAISYGVPVIGYKKWGLAQFLLSDHVIEDSGSDMRDSKVFAEMIQDIVENFSVANWKRQSLTVRDIAAKYSEDHWASEVLSIFAGRKRVLLVTDYIAPIGGIETHVMTIAQLLRDAGCSVEMFWAIEWKPSRLRRIIGLLTSLYDPIVRYRLKSRIELFQPEVIWCHSVARAIGPHGLSAVNTSDALRLKTYHDLGYFGLYATAFEHESELDRPQTFAEFYKHAPLLDRIFPLYIWLKFKKLRQIAGVLRDFDLHIVPSDFMKQAVATYLNSPEASISTIPHAIHHERT